MVGRDTHSLSLRSHVLAWSSATSVRHTQCAVQAYSHYRTASRWAVGRGYCAGRILPSAPHLPGTFPPWPGSALRAARSTPPLG